jgi:ABC-type lipopolysaccharide export system ATPase subunit
MKEGAYPLAKRSQKHVTYIRHQSDAGPIYRKLELEGDVTYLLEILHTTKPTMQNVLHDNVAASEFIVHHIL